MGRFRRVAVRVGLGALLALAWTAGLPGAPAARAESEADCIRSAAPEWTAQEIWVWGRLCAGERADLNAAGRFGPTPKPTTEADWTAERTLRTAFFQTILTEEAYAKRLANRPLFVLGAWFKDSFEFEDAEISASVYFWDSRFDSTVNFFNATVKGDLSFNRSAVADELNVTGATVGGTVEAEQADLASVLMEHSEINDTVEFSGSTVRGPLSLSGSVVGGAVFLNEKADLQAVRINYAEIGGSLVGSSATFRQELSGVGLKVSQNVYLDEGTKVQDVDLRRAHLSGDLDVSGASVEGYLDCSGATVDGALRLASGSDVVKWGKQSRFDLRRATVAGIDDTAAAWPQSLLLGGFVYRDIAGHSATDGPGLGDRDVEWYRTWLARGDDYSRQPYRQLETSLRSIGRARIADSIAMTSKDQEFREATVWRRGLGLLHKVTVGYGYHPEYALGWAGLFLAAGALAARRLPRSPAAPSRLILSAQRLIPLVSFGEAYTKVDTSSPTWVRRYFYVHACVGYVLAAFLLAALARVTET